MSREHPRGRTGGLAALTVDGRVVAARALRLEENGLAHHVTATLGDVPAAREASPEAPPSSSRVVSPEPRTRLRPDVLVVDDDDALRNGILRLLEDEGLTGIGASDGLEALQRLDEGVRPRLVLVDLEMPRMNGWSFVRKLEDQPAFGALPIAVMSGIATPGFAPPRRNDAGFLRKPLEPADVLGLARTYAGGAGGLAHAVRSRADTP